MVKRLVAGLAVGALISLAMGCGGTIASPVPGFILMNVKWDGDAEGAVGAKEGKACAKTIMGWVASGDASIATAAANGGIRNVTRVDHTSKHTLGIIGEYCTVVGGS